MLYRSDVCLIDEKSDGSIRVIYDWELFVALQEEIVATNVADFVH